MTNLPSCKFVFSSKTRILKILKNTMLISGLFFMIIALSCNEQDITAEPLAQPVFNKLKAGTIGSTYYVSPTGRNINSGSESQPFLTPAFAASFAKPGDVIIFEDGVYPASAGGIVAGLSRSGTSSAYITFRARNKGGAVLDGRNNASLGGFSVSGSYINIEGFELKEFSEYGFEVRAGASYINIRDIYIHDIGRRCTDTNQGLDAFFISGSSFITIERCLIHDIGRFSPGENGCTPATQYYKNHDHGTYIDGSSNITIKNNVFFNINRGFALHVYSGSGRPSSYVNFINNTCDNGNPYQAAGHIILWGSMNNSLIANNIFKDQVSSAIHIYQGSFNYSDVTITKNMTSGGNGLISMGSASGVAIIDNYNSTDPLFTNEAEHDYSLRSNSPAINAGHNTQITTDYLNNTRSTLDIGAHSAASKAPAVVVPVSTSTKGTYYVSPTGSNSNPGSESRPFLTAAFAASLASPGDIIIFEDGTYTTNDGGLIGVLSRSGSGAGYITYKARNKWGAVMDGRNNASLGGLSVNGSYINIEGFEFKGFSAYGFEIRAGASNVNIRDVYIHDIGCQCTDTDQGLAAFFVTKSSNISIERCLIHDIGRYRPGENGCIPANQYWKNHDHGVHIDGCSYVTIKNNIFYNINSGQALQVYSGEGRASSNLAFVNNTLDDGNTFHHAGHIILWGDLSASLIANNIFKDQLSYAIQIYQGSFTYSNVTITNNITSGGIGIVSSGSAMGVTVNNNYNFTDPLFNNEKNRDYSLQIESPALITGYNTGVSTDFLNNARSTINIGAYGSADLASSAY